MFHAKLLHHIISMEVCVVISDVYNVSRLVSGSKRFSLYRSPIDYATFTQALQNSLFCVDESSIDKYINLIHFEMIQRLKHMLKW